MTTTLAPAPVDELEPVATTSTWDLGYVEYTVTFLGYAPNHQQGWLIEVIVLFVDDDDGTLHAADVADDEVFVANRAAAGAAARELADFLVTWSV